MPVHEHLRLVPAFTGTLVLSQHMQQRHVACHPRGQVIGEKNTCGCRGAQVGGTENVQHGDIGSQQGMAGPSMRYQDPGPVPATGLFHQDPVRS